MADLNFQINVGGNAGEAIGSLKKQLREAQAEVGALSDKFGATSAEAVKAAKRAAELKDRIGDAKALVDTFNSNPILYLPVGFTLGKYKNGDIAPWNGLTARQALLDAIVQAIPPTYYNPVDSISSTPVEIISSLKTNCFNFKAYT